jgi:hypothetical protein
VVTQLENKAPAGNPDEFPAYNPDAEDWALSVKPILDGAERYVEVDEECLRRADSFEDYKRLKLAEYAPAKGPKEPGGRLSGNSAAQA